MAYEGLHVNPERSITEHRIKVDVTEFLVRAQKAIGKATTPSTGSRWLTRSFCHSQVASRPTYVSWSCKNYIKLVNHYSPDHLDTKKVNIEHQKKIIEHYYNYSRESEPVINHTYYQILV
jgi:myo-inositol catabolism protein IolC